MQEVYDRIRLSMVEFIATIPNILIGFIVFLIIFYLSDWVRRAVIQIMRRSGRRPNISLVMGRLARGTTILFGMLVALMIALPSFKPAQLIELLGITSVAIGFAFRDILQNFLSGILILLAEPFRIGDQIIVDEYEGTIEDIQARATCVRTYDNRRVLIPNSVLFTSSVLVNTAFEKRRSEYEVGIGYDDDIEAAQQIMIEVMARIEGVLADPSPEAIMVAMGDSAVIIRMWWWTDPHQANVLSVQNRVLRAVKNELTAQGFDIPFPIRTVYFHQQQQGV